MTGFSGWGKCVFSRRIPGNFGEDFRTGTGVNFGRKLCVKINNNLQNERTDETDCL